MSGLRVASLDSECALIRPLTTAADSIILELELFVSLAIAIPVPVVDSDPLARY